MLPTLFKQRDRVPSLFDDKFVLENLFDDFDRIFGTNVFTNESGDAVYQLEVPGFNKDNLEVEISDGVLTIKGDRKVKDKNYVGQSSMYKRLTVGSDVEDASAKITDGILTVTLKRAKTEPGKKIEVE